MSSKFAKNISLVGGAIFLVSGACGAHATLSFEVVNGTDLIYDSVENVTWTQDGDISGQTFTFQDAQTWAANLSEAGVPAGDWQLPDADQFTSLYDQLDGTGDKYGTQVFFGPGPDDFVTNVNPSDPEYWTDTDSTDFNFFYGYPGSQPDSNLYSAWALTEVTVVPEPSTLAFGVLACGFAIGKKRFGRKQSAENSARD
jgi:hypothetical protein